MSHKSIGITLSLLLILPILYFISAPIRRYLIPSGIKTYPVELLNDIEYQFKDEVTISPNNNWIVYVGKSNDLLYDGMPDYNIVVYNLVQKQKYILDKKGLYGTQLAHGLNRSCWSSDSKYCYLSNDTEIAIDTSNPIPVLNKKKPNDQPLTCSDCSVLKQEKRFSEKQYGYISFSPNKMYELQLISYGKDLVSQPYLYLIKGGIRRYIGVEIYSINWTSDSASAYVLKRDSSLYRINL